MSPVVFSPENQSKKTLTHHTALCILGCYLFIVLCKLIVGLVNCDFYGILIVKAVGHDVVHLALIYFYTILRSR